MRFVILIVAPLGAVLASGCKRDAADPQAAASAVPRPSEVRAADGMPVEIPTKRTPAPTLADWDKAPALREGSAAAAKCTVKMVREWVRVDCAGERQPGGTPSDVEVRSGCSKDTYVSMKTHANAVLALSPGRRCEILFSWTGTKQTFLADWPHNKRPTLTFVDPVWSTTPRPRR
ncbi:MAG: hypothetical protein IT374_21890 [Polyangiaceae bacterium]|nr:hypothetical protein [Polyangiaceae bacterium]